MKVVVKNIVGENCITLDDGQKIFDLIHDALLKNKTVELDFSGVNVFASPFLNSAIGQLVRDVKTENLNKHLKVKAISPYGRATLTRVIENSKNFYNDRKYRKTLGAILQEYAEEA
jgi:hypothetical protein